MKNKFKYTKTNGDYMEKIKNYFLKETFGINLKWYRFEKKLSQEQLAELIGCNPKYISALERGICSPSLEMIEKISKILNIEAYKLLKPEHVDDRIKLKRIDSKKEKYMV